MSSNSHKFQTTAVALNAFYSISNSNTYTVTKKKRIPGSNKQVSIELINNPLTDISPHQLAGVGDLDGLKSFIKTFDITLKERDDNEATLLHHAAASNQTDIMNYLIESGIELDATDKDGHTALHVAVYQGHIEATNLLLSNGIDDTILNKAMDAALHVAIRGKNTELLVAFLSHPNIDLLVAGCRRRTPLHVAAEHDNVEMCEVIHNCVINYEHLKKNTSFRLCAPDEDDLTPIHLAARKGSHRVLDMFMTKCKLHGYPVEVILGFIDEENSTPLHAAIDGGHIKVVEVLLKHGADPLVEKDGQVPPFLMACSQGKIEMVDLMLKYCSTGQDLILCHDVYGQTCLHRCAQAINSSHIISYLVEKGAKVNATDNKGQTPLMMSIIAGSLSGVNALLERGADVLIKDDSGRNALHHAVIRNRKKIVHNLIKLPSAAKLVMDVDRKETSPIHHALKLGFCSLVNPLIAVIQYKLKNIKDNNGNNYLHLAAQSGDWKALSKLLEISECLKLLNETNVYGGTPLHSAAYGGHTRCVELLLAHGAMIHKCYAGSTPFMVACSRGHAEVAHILYDAHPFQLAWTNDEGQTSLHIAVNSGNPQVITLLLDIGTPIIHDFLQESFLDLIIQKNDMKCAAAVIEHDRYQECLDLVSPLHPHPMVSFIIQMPEIARKVLERLHTKADVACTNLEYWEKFDFKYLRLRDPLPHTAKNQEEEKNAKLEADEKVMLGNPIIQYKRKSQKQKQSVKSRRYHCPKLSHLETLQTMVRYNRSGLLTHPVCSSYLKSKWRNYGRMIHITLSTFSFLQALFALIFTTLVPQPTVVQASSSLRNSSIICEQVMNDTIQCLEFSHGANICRFIALTITFLNFVIWLVIVIQIRQDALNVIANSYILIDILSIIFTIYYLLPTKGLNDANWEAGAVGCFFAWFSVVLKIQLFDLFGVYITMFLSITRRVFQVLMVCFLFIIAFALSLYILVGNLKQYSSIGYSLFINFGHLLGELDYETFVREDVDGNLQFDWLTFIFVTGLAILMGIVIMNLLIGLAVGDIDEIRSNAIAEKKSIEVAYVSVVDVLIPSKILWHLDKSFHIIYPNHPVYALRRMSRFTWRALKGENPNLSDPDESSLSNASLEQKSKEILQIKEKVEELSLTQERVLEALAQLKEMQENMMKIVTSNAQYNVDN